MTISDQHAEQLRHEYLQAIETSKQKGMELLAALPDGPQATREAMEAVRLAREMVEALEAKLDQYDAQILKK